MNQSIYLSTIASVSEAVSQFDLLVVPSHVHVQRVELQGSVDRVLRSILSSTATGPVLLDARPVVVLRRRWEDFCFRKLRLVGLRGAMVGEVHQGADTVNTYVAGVRQLGARYVQIIGESSELKNIGYIVAELLHSRLSTEPMGVQLEPAWRAAEVGLWRKSARSLQPENLHQVIAASACAPEVTRPLQVNLAPCDREKLNRIMSSETELKAHMDSRFIYTLRQWWDSSENDNRFEIAALALLLHAFGERLRVPWVTVESDAELALYLSIHEPIAYAGDLRPLAWSCARLARMAAVAGTQKGIVEGATDMAERIASAHRYGHSAPALVLLARWLSDGEDSARSGGEAGCLANEQAPDGWSQYTRLDPLIDGDVDWSKLTFSTATIAGVLRHGPASRVRVSHWMCPARSRLACVLLDQMFGERWRTLLLAESREDLIAFDHRYKSSADMVTFPTLAAMALASMAATIAGKPSLLDGMRARLARLTTISALGEYGNASFRDDLDALMSAAKAVYSPILQTSVETLADILGAWSDPELYPELATELLLLGDAPVLPGYGPAYADPERNRDVSWSGQHLELLCLHTVYGRYADSPQTCRLGGSFLVLSRLQRHTDLDWYALRLWLSFTTERHPFERLQIEKYAKEQGVKMPHTERDDNLSAALNAGITDWITCTSMPGEEILRARIDRIAQALWSRREELEAPTLRTP